MLAEQVAASIESDPAPIVELREELRERVAEQRWRVRQARRPRRRELYSEQQIAHALALVDSGKSLHEAAAAIGTTHTTVMRWRRRAA
ncbi:helix-turn-helix domain-containing protein [Solirubrobacter ginsenosidimutans]|uniref:Helix-turn-helix domain-containing protein n=1 Tax=Solirubrobacter ginsenosidimutans TaxID=490573 RepID=A0A9X3MXD5_9ACTN|nr:helix-turn-helix domain-containing protein [Solirubrobacter ginsenosidimutans]MDA0164277.1 helix-turn-helix domain-containing protein [Solirubrobacter ginsenosidimutans]